MVTLADVIHTKFFNDMDENEATKLGKIQINMALQNIHDRGEKELIQDAKLSAVSVDVFEAESFMISAVWYYS